MYATGTLGFTNAELVLARGDGFADALAGSSYSGTGKPLLLTAGTDQLGAPTRTYISANTTAGTKLTALGGPLAITNGVLTDAAAARAGH